MIKQIHPDVLQIICASKTPAKKPLSIFHPTCTTKNPAYDAENRGKISEWRVKPGIRLEPPKIRRMTLKTWVKCLNEGWNQASDLYDKNPAYEAQNRAKISESRVKLGIRLVPPKTRHLTLKPGVKYLNDGPKTIGFIYLVTTRR